MGILTVLELALLVMACASASAETRPAADRVSVPLSVRQLGMGDVGIAGSDVLRAWCNPALLGEQEAQGVGAITGGALFGGQTAGGLGGGWRLRDDWTVGALVSYGSVSAQEVNSDGKEVGSISHSIVSGGVSAAMRWQWLRAGITLKGVSETLANNTMTAFVVEPGVLARFGAISAGASLRNMALGSMATVKERKIDVALSSEIRAGAAYALEAPRITVGAELAAPFYYGTAIGLGAEWWPVEKVAVRAGANIATGAMRITAGLSALVSGIGFDYAFSTHPVGMSNRVSLSCAFGRREAAAEPAKEAAPAAAPAQPQAAQPAADTAQMYQAASAMYSAGDYDGAWRKSVEILNADPTHWQAWQLVGNCQYAKGDKAGALTSYRESLRLHPDNPGLKTFADGLAPR